jgi:hypothetical protein
MLRNLGLQNGFKTLVVAENSVPSELKEQMMEKMSKGLLAEQKDLLHKSTSKYWFWMSLHGDQRRYRLRGNECIVCVCDRFCVCIVCVVGFFWCLGLDLIYCFLVCVCVCVSFSLSDVCVCVCVCLWAECVSVVAGFYFYFFVALYNALLLQPIVWLPTPLQTG